MIRDMHEIVCSTKLACSSGDLGFNHALKAIGLSYEEAYSVFDSVWRASPPIKKSIMQSQRL